MRQARVMFLGVATGVLGFLVIAPEEVQARQKARLAASVPSTSNPTQFVQYLLSNQQQMLAYEFRQYSKQEAELNKLLTLELKGSSNTGPTLAKIADLEGDLNEGVANLLATQAYTDPNVRTLVILEGNPTLAARQLALLNFQEYNIRFFANRPAATPFAS